MMMCFTLRTFTAYSMVAVTPPGKFTARRHDVSDIAADEKVAGLCLKNEVGNHSGIGAGKEEHVGGLPIR